jgi:MerR family redox-sensitive transcriptional activator SoxR
MPMLSIGEVAERAGVRPSAIRYYEKAGLLPAADRVHGQRVFDEPVLDEPVLDDLTFIGAAPAAGFGIGEIKAMVADLSHLVAPGDRWRTVAEAKTAEIDAEIAELQRRRELLQDYRRCACANLEDYRLGR